MSFFGSMMGDFEDDPITGHMRQMNSMMNSIFNSSPFGGLMGGPTDLMPFGARHGGGNAMMPFGFPNMSQMFQGMTPNNGNCHAFSSSTVMSMTNGPDGRPQVYHASQSVRSGPGGVHETKKTVADSRTGVKKMAIGHHIGDRAHILEKEQNIHSGDLEEREELINLEEDDATEFNREWHRKARTFTGARNAAIGYPSHHRNPRNSQEEYPMLPPAPSQSTYRSRPRLAAHRRHNDSNYPSLPPSSQSNVIVCTDEEEEEEDKHDSDSSDSEGEESGVKIVELDDDDEEEEERNFVENLEETDPKDDITNRKKNNDKSRKREHEPDDESARSTLKKPYRGDS